MKKIAAVLTAVVILAVAVGLLLFPPTSKSEKRKADVAEVVKPKQDTKMVGAAQAAPADIAELARQKNSATRDQLVDMYVNWAGKPDKMAARRSIIREIIANEEAAMALHLIVTAVSRDPTPYKSDEMLTPIARDMVGIWKSGDIYSKGMDVMRLTDNSKAQAVLAESLTVRFTSPPAGMENLETQRYALVSDLSYMYREGAQDPDIKTQILQDIQSVGGSEMAELAVNPGNPNAAYFKRKESERAEAVNTAPPAP